MKSAFAISTALCLSTLMLGDAFSQSGWTWQNPLPQGNHLNSISFGAPGIGTAVGSYGTIIRTTDGGVSWKHQTASTPVTLTDVCFIDAMNGITVGRTGIIMRTTDGGEHWFDQTSGTTRDLRSVCLVDSLFGVAVGELDSLLRTTDGGNTWEKRKVPPPYWRYGVSFADRNTGFVVGMGNTVHKTTDGGESWKSIVIVPDYTWKTVECIDTNYAVVGGVKRLARTTDGGESWRIVDSSHWDYSSISFFTPTVGMAAGYEGSPGSWGWILSTTDGGATWKRFETDSLQGINNPGLHGIAMTDQATGYAVGAYGVMFKSTDSGSSWQSLSSGTRRWLVDVWFTNPNSGYAVGGSFMEGSLGLRQAIVQTTDGGNTWFEARVLSSEPFLERVEFADQNLGLAVGDSGTIVRTSDGGTSWWDQTSGTEKNLKGISFGNGLTALAVGDEGIVLRTTDGGIAWDSLSAGSHPLRGVAMRDAQTAVVVGDRTILMTTDCGATWTHQGEVAEPLQDVTYVDSDTAVAVGLDGIVCRSTDGGLTWRSQTLTHPHGILINLRHVFFSDAKNGTATMGGGGIWRTTDGGQTWLIRVFNSDAGQSSTFFLDAVTGWSVGSPGCILHTTDGGVTWAGDAPSAQVPVKENLYQNYPNPFNPSTTIRFELPERSKVVLAVYNTLGQLVATLVQGEQEAGSHEVKFDGRGLASGVYIYRLHSGVFTETRPMVLLR